MYNLLQQYHDGNAVLRKIQPDLKI